MEQDLISTAGTLRHAINRTNDPKNLKNGLTNLHQTLLLLRHRSSFKIKKLGICHLLLPW